MKIIVLTFAILISYLIIKNVIYNCITQESEDIVDDIMTFVDATLWAVFNYLP